MYVTVEGMYMLSKDVQLLKADEEIEVRPSFKSIYFNFEQ